MFFLKHATEPSFLISIGILFHSLVAERASTLCFSYIFRTNSINARVSSVARVPLIIQNCVHLDNSEFKEFNKTITPFALVGYETGYSQLGATRLVGYLPSHIQRALME